MLTTFLNTWYSSRKLFASLLVGLFVIGGVVLGKSYLLFNGHTFLRTQAAALRPGFGADVQLLDEAPRYEIVARADTQTGTVSGISSVWYSNRSDTELSELVFRLYPNASSIYSGGSLTVQDVNQSGQSVETVLSADQTVLTVQLDRPLEPGQSTTVEMTFQTSVPDFDGQGYGILSQAKGVMFLAGWYPVLAVYDEGWIIPEVPVVGDAMLAETSLYEVWLSTHSGYSLVSTGSVLETQDDGEEITWHVASGPAREFAAALSTEFEVQQTQLGSLILRSYTLPSSSADHSPEEGLSLLTGSFEAFQEIYGPYPYREFEMVESVITIGGYEFSGMVTIDEALRREGKLVDYRYLIAHEAAHQWWYGLVGTQTVHEPWLDEAHATYSAALYLERAVSAEEAQALVNFWQESIDSSSPNHPPVNSSALDFTDWSIYENSVYVHGALFLHHLRQEMGDEAFFELERQYQDEHRYEFGSTESFLQMAEETAESELDEVYTAWLDLSLHSGLNNPGEADREE